MKYRGFLIDENLQIPKTEIEGFPDTTVYNTTEFFSNGTSDDHILEWLKESNYVLVTSDIRMAMDALMNDLPVLFYSKKNNKIKFLEICHECDNECMGMEKYFGEKYIEI